jgi:acyl carrier protein
LSFVVEPGAASLVTLAVLLALYWEFETDLPDVDAEKITTVQQAIDYVGTHLKK